MIPLELRNRRDWRGPQQYEPFRPTLFSTPASASHLGPGSFFTDKSFAPPSRASQPPLYRTERDVNPTVVASVQRFYDASRATNVGDALLEHAGSTATSLKSAVPRFQSLQLGTNDAVEQLRRGPGAYSPEKYHGAFAATLEKATPAAARSDKQRAKRAFDTSFAIVPSASVSLNASVVRGLAGSRALVPSGMKRAWLHNRVAPTPRAADRVELESSSRRLAVALTPRNAYHDPTNRELVLATRQQQQEEVNSTGEVGP